MATQTGIRSAAAIPVQHTSPASEASPKKYRTIGPVKLTIICSVLLAVAVAVGATLLISNIRERAFSESERNLKNTALILSNQIEDIFRTIERVQKIIINQNAVFRISKAADREYLLSSHDIHVILRNHAAGMPYLGSFTIVNAQGRVINFSRQWPIPEIDVTDRDFFLALQSDPNLTSFVSSPVRNRATGSWVIHFARKISDESGKFSGILTAAIELQALQDIISEIALVPNGRISLFRQDGVLLAAAPWIEANIGHRLENALSLKIVAKEGSGIDVSKGTISDQDRIIASHRVGEYPIVISASDAVDVVLADWRKTAIFTLLLAAVGIFAIATAAATFVRMLRNYKLIARARAEQEDREQKRLFINKIIDNVPLAVIVKTVCDRRIAYVNRATQSFWGNIARSEAIGKTVFDLFPEAYAAQITADDNKALQAGYLLIDDPRGGSPAVTGA